MAVNALEKMMFCPELRKASDVAIFKEDFSYACSAESYSRTWYFSLLKCYLR